MASTIRLIEKLNRAIEIIIQEANHRGLDWQGDAEFVLSLLQDVLEGLADQSQGTGNAARCRRYRLRVERATHVAKNANHANGSDMVRHDSDMVSDMPHVETMSQESSPFNGSSPPLRKGSPIPSPKESPPLSSLTSPSENAPKRRKPQISLPDGWAPKPMHFAFAADHGHDERWVFEFADVFRTQCDAKDYHYANHDKAFLAWMQKEVKGQANGHARTETAAERRDREGRQATFDAIYSRHRNGA